MLAQTTCGTFAMIRHCLKGQECGFDFAYCCWRYCVVEGVIEGQRPGCDNVVEWCAERERVGDMENEGDGEDVALVEVEESRM